MKKTTSKKWVTCEKEDLEELGFSSQDFLNLYYYMRLSRQIEERVINLYRQGKILGGVYTGIGHEAISVGSAYLLQKEDVLLPMHRDMGAHLVKGQTVERIFAQYLGRKDGVTRGRDGNMHHGDLSRNIVGMISHLAAMIPVAAGVALAGRLQKKNWVALTYIGDGGSNVGDFHEGLNFAGALRLPVVLIIENNQFAYSTPLSKQTAATDLADRAVGYGIPGVIVDGNDVLAVTKVCKEAFARARAGEGPTLIEAKTMRMRGHSEHDDHSYVPPELLERWKKRDPIERYEQFLTEHALWKAEDKTEIDQRVKKEIERGVAFAEASPFPEGKEAVEDVYAP